MKGAGYIGISGTSPDPSATGKIEVRGRSQSAVV